MSRIIMISEDLLERIPNFINCVEPRFIFHDGSYWEHIGGGKYRRLNIKWRCFAADMKRYAEEHHVKMNAHRMRSEVIKRGWITRRGK